MPTKYVWVKPKRFLKCLGVEVFHDYGDDDADDIMTYWYKVGDPFEEDQMTCFDVRDLPEYDKCKEPRYSTSEEWLPYCKARAAYHRSIIRAAIKAGIITNEGVKLP